jgi:heptosyltransferase-2
MVNRQARFLILRGGAIGDFMLTLPALHALRERWPEAYIELVGYPHIARLAIAGGLADHVVSLDAAGIARFFSRRPTFPDEQVAYIRSFDVIISYLHDPDGIVKENLLCAGARQVIYGSPIVDTVHAIDHLTLPLETLAIYCRDAVPRLSLRADLVAAGRSLLDSLGLGDRPFAIHPGSGSPKKNWPVDRFLELGRRVVEAGHAHPFYILGEADHAMADAVQRNASGIPVLTGQTLEQLAAVLSQCAGYIGNDSGITHLAGALGIPTVALFGPSDPDRWGPRGPQVRVMRARDGDISALSLDDVWNAVVAVS